MSGGPGTNTGHGHVWPRPDGVKARCGGPKMCPECARDYAAFHSPPMTPEQTKDERAFAWLIETGDHMYWTGRRADMTSFTSDHMDAVRFARKEDADRLIGWLLNEFHVFLVAREHGWLGAGP